MAAALSEPRDALEEIIEPYLLQQGFIARTPRGRILTLRAWKHLGLTAPKSSTVPDLFAEKKDKGDEEEGSEKK
jgi:Holliday junction DNA helicase RuvB